MKLASLYGIAGGERPHELIGAVTAPFGSAVAGILLFAIALSDLTEPTWSFASPAPSTSLARSASMEWTRSIVSPTDKLPASVMRTATVQASTLRTTMMRPSAWSEMQSPVSARWGGEPDEELLKFRFGSYGQSGHEIAQEISCLAQNIYFEARSEPHQGKLAVAHVVLNRVASERFPSSVCEVVQQGGEIRLNRCQFSWWCDGKSDKPGNFRAWRESLVLASDIYWGLVDDPTEGAMWYHADYVSPGWSADLKRGPKIGRHIFYASKSSQVRQQLAAKSTK